MLESGIKAPDFELPDQNGKSPSRRLVTTSRS